jgi:type IV secretory pathway TrbD component
MKNIALFGLTLWLLADAIEATRKQATPAISRIHLRSYARFGLRRRVNHPGE